MGPLDKIENPDIFRAKLREPPLRMEGRMLWMACIKKAAAPPGPDGSPVLT
jgi:hypothetical protein